MEKTLYKIKFIGLTEHEKKVLNAIFMLSRTRSIVFSLYEDTENSKPEIMIVNFDDSEAVDEWQNLCIQDTGHSSIPVIRVTQARGGDIGNYYARRPFIATRMLSLFEGIVVKEFSAYDNGTFQDDSLPNSDSAGKSPDGSGRSDGKSLKSVLVIDDSLPVRMQMNMALQSYVDKIDMAETGEKALELIRENCYDLIFLDVVLPGMDGCEICKMIKNDENSRATPVIMLTGNSLTTDQVKEAFAECDSYLIKPVRSDLFEETMNRYIS